MITTAREAKSSLDKRSRRQLGENGDFACFGDKQCCKLSGMLNTPTTLLQRVRDLQDEKSWGEFVALYEPLLLSYVRGRVAPETDARDIVQDIFLTLLRVLPTFELDRVRGRFRTWLWRITSNAIIDDSRRQRRHKKSRSPLPDDFAESVSDDRKPDEEWLRAHRQRILEYVLSQMRDQTHEKTWHCFEQHILGERGCAEVAAEVGLTANAVCANSIRVLAKVRARCAEYEEEMGDADDEPLPGR